MQAPLPLEGDKGDPGAQGATGAQGNAGPKGDKGDPGAQGADGPQGSAGFKGDKGDPGTGNGDITVVIPSNVGVTIRAESDLADTMRRIVSDFPGVAVRMLGTQVVAEGPVNGGGPLLRISGMGGTIFIKRQP